MPMIVFEPVTAVLPSVNPASLTQGDSINFSYKALSFNKDTDQFCYWIFQMDKFYNSGPITLHFFWICGNTTGNVVWQANLAGIIDNEDWVNANPTTVTWVQDAAPGTAWYLSKASLTFSSTGLSPNDLVILKISRDANSTYATDDLDTTANLLNLVLEYNVAG